MDVAAQGGRLQNRDEEGAEMRKWIRHALTRTVILPAEKKKGKQTRKMQLPPPEALIYGVVLLLVFFIVLSALQALHLLVTGKLSAEIWSGIMVLIGVLVGAFFGGRS